MKYLCGFAFLVVAGFGGAPHAVAPEPLRFVSVTAGADHVCALNDVGDAYCWGSNALGQLGSGTADSMPHPTPLRVRSDVKFTAVSAGFTHTCALARDGSAWCWGANDTAQLGDGTTKNAPIPTPIPGRVSTDPKFKTIAAGGGHTCAVSVDDIGYCWGGNWHGQLGVGDRDGDVAAPCCYRLPRPIRTELRLRAAVAAGISSCAVALDGRAYCWGSPQEGRLGTGATDAANKGGDKTIPTAVVGDISFETVLPRAWHTCGLSSIHAVFCWGGDLLQMKSAIPERVAGLSDVSTITTGHFHDCALARGGTAFCWGTNTDGELGDGTTRDSAVPQRVLTTRRFVSIAAGGNIDVSTPGKVATWGFTCAVTADDGSVLCWGDNRHGALGNGSTDRALIPTSASTDLRGAY
jgi:alpha-tubulin suppressor-like RCC1 family protein